MSLLGVEGQSLAKEPVTAGHVCVLAGQGAMSEPSLSPSHPHRALWLQREIYLWSVLPVPWQGLQGVEHQLFPQSCQQVQKLLSLVP